jgi:RNA polymerase sigma factor (sigma-70 family)
MSYETELVKRVQSGDRKAQKEFYDLYSARFMGIAIRYVRYAPDAEDIIQEAMLKIFRNLETLKDTEAINGWIKRIVTNCAINHFRKEKDAPDASLDAIPISLANEDHVKILSLLSEEELLALIQQLPPKARYTFNMYAIEGYSHKEIAERSNTSEGTSKSQYARGRALLKNMVENLFGVQ